MFTNYAGWALLAGACFAAATLPVFLNLAKRAGKFADRQSLKTKDVAVKINWPSLGDQKPGKWEQLWRWVGWRRGVPSVHRFCYYGIIIFLISMVLVGRSAGALIVLLTISAFIWAEQSARKARLQFARELPDAITSLVDTLQSGLALPQAIKFTADEITGSTQSLFKALSRGQELNLGWEETLRRTVRALDLPEWTMVAETLIAEERLGGNVIPLLQESSNTLRDQQKVESEIKTLTAAGRTSGVLIAGLVPAVLLFFWLASPSYVEAMFTTGIGRMLLAIALSLEIIGFFWIKKIIKVDY